MSTRPAHAPPLATPLRAARLAGCMVAGLLLAGCAGGPDSQADDERPEAVGPASAVSGPPAGLVRGTHNGVMISLNGGMVHVQLNDLATDDLRAAVLGNRITVTCGDGEASGDWPAGRNDVTLFVLGLTGQPDTCMLAVADTELAQVTLQPVGP